MAWLPTLGALLLSLCHLGAQQPLQSFNPPPPPSTLRIFTTNDVLGSYQRTPVLGSTNIGSIIPKPGSLTLLLWTNNAGGAWILTPDFTNQLLMMGADSPFNGQSFMLIQTNGVCTGFKFPGDAVPYTNGVPTPTFGSATYHGYTVSSVATGTASTNWGAGFSFYSATWGMLDKPLAGFQVGQVGTWLQPYNGDSPYPVLPPNNFWVTNYPSSNPRSWDGLYQTIEGSPGFWGGTQFPTVSPKYRMNGTYDSYDHQISSPGWGFGGGGPSQPTSVMGLAQLSNRILTPADGFTFASNPNGAFVGYAWMALPLIPARNPGTTNIVGDQSWTFFIKTTNFSGPIAFYVPDIYTRYAQQVYTNDIGRGMDIKPGVYVPFASEWGVVPMLTQSNSAGNVYGRIPRMLFPTNGAGLSYLASDACVYSRAALFNPVQNWFNGGAAASGTFNTNVSSLLPQPVAVDPSFGINQYQVQNFNGTATNVLGLDNFVQKAAPTTPGGGSAFALQWTSNSVPGVYPEYLQWVTNGWTVITRSQLPADVLLPYASFNSAGTGSAYASDASWNTPAPASTNIVVTLTDGSQVTYVWYKFIDQPSLQGFAWPDAQRQQLQSRVEQLQAAWATNSTFMPPPSSGVLAALDPALFVTPPPGMEVGYVPIVINQTAATITPPALNYLDLNGTTAGFGNINGVITNFGASTAIWTSDATGVAAPVAFTGGKSIIVGNGNNALSGALTLTPTANQHLTGLAILDTGVTLNFAEGTSANFYLYGSQIWSVAAGSTLNENSLLQHGNANSVGMNMGFGATTMTLAGGGTMNFITALGLNGAAGGVILENDPNLTVNLYAAGVGPTGWGSPGTHGFELRNGRLNLASANGANAFAKMYASNGFTIGGGAVILDNTSGGAQTMSVGGAGNNGVVINGNFTFAGSNPLTLSAGTNGVMLTTTPTLTVTNSLTIAGVIRGVSGLIKTGPGTLLLSSNNTYTGNTTVKGGSLALGAGGGIGGSPSIVLFNGAAFDVSSVNGGYTLGGSADQVLGGSGSVNGAVTVGTSGTIAPGSGSSIGSLTLNNPFSLGGTVSMKLSKTGGVITNDQISGITTLTFGGALVVTDVTSDGTPLALGDVFTLFNATTNSSQFTNITLPPPPSNNVVWNTSNLTSGGYIALVASTVRPAFSPGAGIYIGSTPVTLSSTTPGAMIYYTTNGTPPTTNSPNAGSPTVVVPAGTNMTILAYATSAGLPDSMVASATYQTLSASIWTNAAGGSWATSGNWSNAMVANGNTVVADISRVTLSGNRTITLNSTPTVAQLVLGDAGNIYGWTVTNGTGGPLTLDAGGNTPMITVNNRTNAIGAALAGTTGVVKAGVGTLVLSGTNTYTGGTVVSNGTLSFTAVAAEPVSGTLSISNGAILSLSDSGSSGNWPSVPVSGAGTLSVKLSGNESMTFYYDMSGFTGILDIGAGSNPDGKVGLSPAFVSPSASATVKVKSGVTFYLGYQAEIVNCNVQLYGAGNNENLGALRVELNDQQNGPVLLKANSSIGSASGTGYIGGVISDGGLGYGFTKLAGGTIALQAANTFGGDTVTTAGALQLNHALALQNSSVNLSVANGLTFASGITNFTLGGLKGNQNLILQDTASGAVTLRVGNNNASTTYSGILSGAGGLTKIGAGTLTLGGTNTYTGPTAVSNGTLLMNSSLAAGSTVTIQTNGTLSGIGTVNGATTVQPGGTVAPGTNGIGRLTFGSSLMLAGKTVMEISHNGSVTTNDLVAVTGMLIQSGALIVTNTGTNALVAGDSFKLFTAGAWKGGFTSLTLPALGSGLSWKTNTLATNGTLAVTLSSYTLTYAAGTNGTVSGVATQTVNYGASGSAVTAVGNNGSAFTNWSDGLTANPRTDSNVTSNLNVTAYFALLAPPVLTNPHLTLGGTAFVLAGMGGANVNYVLLTATNLSTAAWLPVQTNQASASGTFQFTDLQVTNYTQRFYRVQTQ